MNFIRVSMFYCLSNNTVSNKPITISMLLVALYKIIISIYLRSD